MNGVRVEWYSGWPFSYQTNLYSWRWWWTIVQHLSNHDCGAHKPPFQLLGIPLMGVERLLDKYSSWISRIHHFFSRLLHESLSSMALVTYRRHCFSAVFPDLWLLESSHFLFCEWGCLNLRQRGWVQDLNKIKPSSIPAWMGRASQGPVLAEDLLTIDDVESFLSRSMNPGKFTIFGCLALHPCSIGGRVEFLEKLGGIEYDQNTQCIMCEILEE